MKKITSALLFVIIVSFSVKAQCPSQAQMVMIAEDTNTVFHVGQGNTNNIPSTMACNTGSPFCIYPQLWSTTSASTYQPCLRTRYDMYYTSVRNNVTESRYENGSLIFTLAPGNPAANRIGGSVPPANGASLWDFSLYQINPTMSHSVSICKTGGGVVTTDSISVRDCWRNNTSYIYASNAAFNTGCGIAYNDPANSGHLGSTAWSIAPASGASAIFDMQIGMLYVDPIFLTPGTYTVTYTFTPPTSVPSCGSVTSNYIFTVTNPYTANWSAPANLCDNGTCINLPPTVTGSAGGSWSGVGVSGTQFCPSTSGTGTFAVTYDVGPTVECGATQTNNVTVNPSPTLTMATNSYSMCVGGNASISVGGANTYTWTPGGSLNNANSSNPTATPGSTQVYTVTGTSALGCVSTTPQTATVTVSNPPTISVGSSTYTMCPGGSVGMSVSGASSYTWSPAGSLDNPNISNPTANPGSTQVYTVNGTSPGGCVSSTPGTATVTVNTPVTLVLSPSPAYTMCPGGSVTMNVSGASTYTWTPSTNLSNANVSNPTANPGSTQVYSVSGTDASGCISAAGTTATVTVNTPVTLNVTTPSPTICAGSNTGLNVTGANTYTWSPAGSLNNPNISNPTANPGSTQVYTVTGTDASGCIASAVATATVNVNLLPVLTVTAAPTSLCTGGTTTLSVSGASTYTWSANAGSSQASSVPVTPAATDTYTVNATDANGCNNSGTITVAVNGALSVTITPSQSNICSGQTATLTASGATNYTWSPGNFSTTTITVNPNTNTTYTLTGDNGGSCQGTTALTLTVTATPTITASASNASICSGNSTTLTATGNATTYTWMPGGATTNTVSVNPNTTTIYTLTGVANGCPTNTVTTVNVTTSPVVTATAANSGTVCAGNSISLNSAGSTGAFTFTWMPGNSQTPNINVSPASNTTYTLYGTSANGLCKDSGNVSVTVLAVPTLTVNSSSANDSVCSGSGPVTLTAAGNAVTYTWMPGNIANPASVNPAVGVTTYSLIATGANGCKDSTTLSITVSPTPTVVISTSPSATICSGQSVTFSSTGATNYTWMPGGTTGPNLTVTPANSATYNVIGVSAGACASLTNTVAVVVNQSPTVIGSAQVDSAKCGIPNGSVATLTVTNGQPLYTYLWSNGSTADSLTGVAAGTYSVLITDANGCTVTSGVTSFTVGGSAAVVAAITPKLTTGQAPLNVTFTNNTVGATVWNWVFGNGLTSASQNASSIYTTPGTYTVVMTATNGGGCKGMDTAIVIVDVATSIIIPNIFSPNGDGINDIFFIANTGMKSLNCDIFNRWGTRMYTLNAPQQVWDGKTPNGENASEGTYFYILTAQGYDGKTYNYQGPLTLVK